MDLSSPYILFSHFRRGDGVLHLCSVSFKGANVCIIYEKTKAISLQNITWSELGKKTYKLKSYQSDQKITLLCDVLSEIIDYQARTLLKLCCAKILSLPAIVQGGFPCITW